MRNVSAELFSILAINPIGRISAGDQIIIDSECDTPIGSIVVCLPDYRLMEYRGELGDRVIGKVVRFIINPD